MVLFILVCCYDNGPVEEGGWYVLSAAGTTAEVNNISGYYSPLDCFNGCCSIEGLVATDGGG